MTKIGLYNIVMSTTLESNKSLARLAISPILSTQLAEALDMIAPPGEAFGEKEGGHYQWRRFRLREALTICLF